MKIAIPTDDGVSFAAHTGRAAGVIVYRIEDGKISLVDSRFRDNPHECDHSGEFGTRSCAEQSGGQHGHHSHEDILSLLEGCDVLLAWGAGPRLVNDLAQRGIRVQLCRERNVERALAMFSAGSLTINETGSCDHGLSGDSLGYGSQADR